MIEIKIVDSKVKKTQITLEIMNALPEWFSPAEDIVNKSAIHRDYPFIAAFNEREAVGFAALKIHNSYTAELYTLGVLKEYHRMGIGHQIMDLCISYCRDKNYKFLTVKTLDSSAVYEPYEVTRKFYKREGFYPLEVFKTFWNEENPCLFLIKIIE